MSTGFSTVSVSESLQHKVIALGDALRVRSWQLSTAESCTGGGIAFALTSVAGSSDWFHQSWVTYSNEAKTSLIGVPDAVLAAHGAVSEQTVEAMVRGVVKQSGAQLAVSVSGIAGPGGGSDEKPVGTVWFGFYREGEVRNVKYSFDGDRQAVRSQAVAVAIEKLHDWLVEGITPV